MIHVNCELVGGNNLGFKTIVVRCLKKYLDVKTNTVPILIQGRSANLTELQLS